MSKIRIFLGLFLALGLGLALSLIHFVWHTDREWAALIQTRIQEHRELSSIRVLVKNKDGEQRWLGAYTAGRLEERQALRLSQIPPLLMQAIVSVEDPRFLSHEGFDTWGILRATWVNIQAMRYAQGGSTITQQLVKNVFLSSEKTLRRKLTELVLAALVERNFSKDEILEAYLNEIYFAQLGPVQVHGVGRAAEFYFDKKIAELELHEAALLAALVRGPGFYSPWRHPERALTRRNFVLSKLLERNLILEDEYHYAIAQALPLQRERSAPIRAPYLMDALRQQLLSERGEEALLKNAFDIHLALDLEMQVLAERILLEASQQWDNPNKQAIIVAASPQDCRIRTYVGGTQYAISQLDHIRQIQRPVGSLLKPLLVYRLLDDGELHLATQLQDERFTWSFDRGRNSWSPQNYDRRYRGWVSLRQSLEESLNIPFARIFHQREPNGLLWNELDPLRALGLLVPEDRALPSAILGSIEQSPWRILQAFLKLTRMGLGLANNAADWDCQLSFEAAEAHSSEIPASFAHGQNGALLTLSALEGATRRGTAQSLGRQLSAQQAWASKTGSSSDLKDSWFVALSPELVVLSWVGHSDNTPVGLTGASGALPLVQQLITQTEFADFSWPYLEADLEWQLIDVENNCLLPRHTSLATPPSPQIFQQNGKKLRWELFLRDSQLEECPL